MVVANNSDSVEVSQAITRRSASNLAPAFLALDRSRRLAMSALYAFCREVDDIADEEMSPLETRRAELADWRQDVRRACEGGNPQKVVVQELQPIIERYGLSFAYFDELILGVETDVVQDRHETFEDLDRYCYRVASVVGLLSIEIFGYHNDDCQKYAVHLGKALQLTNILRDVGSDADRGRIYLPQKAMEEYGVDPRSLLTHKYSVAFHNLAVEIALRARGHYQKAAELLPPEDRRSMISAECMGAIYWRLLRVMEQSKFRVVGPVPTRIGKAGRLGVFLTIWLRVRLGLRGYNYGWD